MRILFLISSPGRGHARCAEAIDAALAGCGREVETDYLDIHNIIDARVSAAIKDGYLRMIVERPALYQRLYDLDRELYKQLSGEMPADGEIAGFLAEQQQRWFPELAGRSWLVSPRRNLDAALINSLVNGVRESWRFPPNRLLLRGLLQLIHRILSKRLEETIRSRAPDLLVATQMYPGSLLRHAVESGGLKQPLIGVITDYGVHGVWVQPTTHHYCVGHPFTAQMLVDKGVPEERIHVTGIPMMPEFGNPPSQSAARRRLGLDDRPTVLITGGEYGIGTVDAVRQILRQASEAIRILTTAPLAMSGNNEMKRLEEKHPDSLTVYPSSVDIALLMCAADLVVGKPGGLTVSEALACGRPFVVTCSLGGQEAHNVRFLEEYDIGCRITPGGLVPRLLGLLESRLELAAWQERAGKQGRRGGATAVANLIERSIRQPEIREAIS